MLYTGLALFEVTSSSLEMPTESHGPLLPQTPENFAKAEVRLDRVLNRRPATNKEARFWRTCFWPLLRALHIHWRRYARATGGHFLGRAG